MQNKMIFYPNEICLSYAEKVIEEIEKILKNSKKTIENSFLKKYASLLEKGQCDDFLKMCAEKYQLLRMGYPYIMTGPITIQLIFPPKRRLKKKKQLLYSKCLLSLKSTTESNRIFLLKVARVLDKAIAEELEHDLRSQ